jgi:hypothetical protein
MAKANLNCCGRYNKEKNGNDDRQKQKQTAIEKSKTSDITIGLENDGAISSDSKYGKISDTPVDNENAKNSVKTENAKTVKNIVKQTEPVEKLAEIKDISQDFINSIGYNAVKYYRNGDIIYFITYSGKKHDEKTLFGKDAFNGLCSEIWSFNTILIRRFSVACSLVDSFGICNITCTRKLIYLYRPLWLIISSTYNN